MFWGKRIRTHSWQFPQGGINYGETPEQAMFRELHEEVGLLPDHVRIVARTRDWLRYEVPTHFIRRDARGHYRGQKQIWFLLQLTGRDSDMNLRATDHPEFDAWRWNEYWIPLEVVIEFKRDVYQMALTELARFLPRGDAAQPLPALGACGRIIATTRPSTTGAATHCRRMPARASLATTRSRHADGRAADPAAAGCRRSRWRRRPRAQASTRLSRWISSGSPVKPSRRPISARRLARDQPRLGAAVVG